MGKQEPNLILFISAGKGIFQVIIIIIKNSGIICGERVLLAQFAVDC